MNNEQSPSIEGKIHKILAKQEFPSGFTKQEIVIETPGQYPQTIPVSFIKDNISKLNGLREGDSVTVYYNLRGNEHKGRFYAEIQGWRVER